MNKLAGASDLASLFLHLECFCLALCLLQLALSNLFIEFLLQNLYWFSCFNHVRMKAHQSLYKSYRWYCLYILVKNAVYNVKPCVMLSMKVNNTAFLLLSFTGTCLYVLLGIVGIS